MEQNLDELKNEIAIALGEGGFAVFHSRERTSDPLNTVNWDYERYPDPRLFIETARKLGIRIVTFHHRQFESSGVEESIEDLKAAPFPRDQQRDMERRLRKLHDYDGFTCVIELSFAHEGVVYLYELSSPWFNDFVEITSDIHDALDEAEMEDDEDPGPMGGYFSHN
jgi:hypothetical protein